MQSSDEFVQAFDHFRDENPEWPNALPYAVARMFWDAGVAFAQAQK